MSPTSRRLRAFTATAALVLGVAACAQPQLVPGQAAAGEQAAAGAVVQTAHNDADTRFAQLMIVHHRGAIEMAELVAQDAATAEVRDLGQRIAAAQGPEIALMEGWLEAWDEPLPEGDMGDMHHGGTDMDGMQMEGMDQAEAMDELHRLSGVELDRRFLELMTAHHEGAVMMAQEELAEGENSQALDLAQRIVGDQTAEIAVMADLLEGL